ncbi:MAG: hypothetical protein K8F60_18895 [Melioribacteraceae bacterium]|jgi:hypothetical protein|nr:hypothetical protein [Melioribacteraceae bacterium]
MKLLNIGFDFGTFQTKVSIRDIETEVTYAFVFNNNLNSVNRYTIPTNVKINNFGRMHFGISENSAYGAIEFFKLFKIGMENLMRKILIQETEYIVTGKLLVAAYTAYVIRIIKNQVEKDFENGVTFIYQFGLPIDHIGNNDSIRESSFRESFNIGVLLAEDSNINISQGVSLKEMIENYEKKIQIYSNMEINQLKAEIYPETIAGVAALLNNNELQLDYRYSIIDIGAGSTDVSFFDYTNGGVIDGDTAISNKGKFFIYDSKTYDIGNQNYKQDILEQSIQELNESYKKQFGRSYHKDKDKWKEGFCLLQIGGGINGKLAEFINRIEIHVRWDQPTPHYITIDKLAFPFPDNYFEYRVGNVGYLKENFNFLAVSYGLSFPSISMPQYKPNVGDKIKVELKRTPDEPLTPDVG